MLGVGVADSLCGLCDRLSTLSLFPLSPIFLAALDKVSLRVFRPPEVGLVLLASDGLWDVPSAVDGQLAARLSECFADGTPSASAVTAAVRSAVDACGADVGTSDDTTVVAVVLRGGVVTAETTAV